MNKIAKSLTTFVGKTPLLRLNSLSNEYSVEIIGKLEYFNPGGTIIEPTSGNTGIGLAWIAAIRGYSCSYKGP